jgi:hypothetical protein
MFLGSRAPLCARLRPSPPFVSLLSRQCRILNISQPDRPPLPVTGIALLFYVGDVRISKDAHTWTSTACYGDMFLPHRKHAYEPPRPVTVVALLVFALGVLVGLTPIRIDIRVLTFAL